MKLIEYLLESDPAIQSLVSTQLLGIPNYAKDSPLIQAYLDHFDSNTQMFGEGIYSPKWTSTFYTLRHLTQFNIDPKNLIFQQGLNTLVKALWSEKKKEKDICVIAMLVSMLSYGKCESRLVDDMVDFLINHHQIEDGGWNCDAHSTKSSINTTLSVLEAFKDYHRYGYTKHKPKLQALNQSGQQYLLRKSLYLRETDQSLIKNYITDLHFPIHWQYDIYRALDYFASIDYPYDAHFENALNILEKNMKKGLMPRGKSFSGLTHFKLNKTDVVKVNTIRALKVLKTYRPIQYLNLIESNDFLQ